MADGLNFTIPPFPDRKTINPFVYTTVKSVKSSCPGMSASIWMVLGGMILAARMLWLALRATPPEQMDEFVLEKVEGEQAEYAEEHLKDQRKHHRKKQLKPADAANNRRMHWEHSQPRYLPR
ncbi:uncharacterized protein LOC111080236 [Drosophila obscura]|uniref:uncharacterized protein LOC111080236 n=1 Tax=Drosophila obscura TaxID=7282 RepID=UPI001BB17741|nr:uncharacterized protein LOC111080236 [Drosophila obscura]